MKQIYTPSNEPMKVFVLFSGGASSLRAMLDDPNYMHTYRVVGAYTDKELMIDGQPIKGRKLCRDNEIPDLFIDRREFYRSHGLDPKNLESRYKFYEMLARAIEQFHPDVICMSGY